VSLRRWRTSRDCSVMTSEAARRDALPVPLDAPATIGQLVRERLGDAVAETLVDPVLGGVHATRADDAELASVAPSLYAATRDHGGLMPAVRALRGPLGPAGSPVATLLGGMGRLIERLHAVLLERGATVHVRAGVDGLHHDGRWHVRAGRALTADVLCLAVPARTARELLATLAGPIDTAALLRSLDALPTTHDVALVTLHVVDATLSRAGAPVGSGVLVADDTTQAKAMTHASAKWAWLAAQLPEDHHVLRLSYGGTHDAGRALATDAQLIAAARDDARRLLEGHVGDLRVLDALVTRWNGALSRPVVGRTAVLAELDAQLAVVPRLALTGSALAGNGLAGVVGRSRREAARIL